MLGSLLKGSPQRIRLSAVARFLDIEAEAEEHSDHSADEDHDEDEEDGTLECSYYRPP